MKKFTSLLVVILISFFSTAGNFRYNRLERIYESNETRCLKVSKRIIKTYSDVPEPYYFASAVYRNKSKKHSNLKTRYLMMSKSIGYAMKFQDYADIDLLTKVNWNGYLEELLFDIEGLVLEMEVTDLAIYGDRLEVKHQKMLDRRDEFIVVAATSHGPVLTPIGDEAVTNNENDTNDMTNPLDESATKIEIGKGYFGLPTGEEVAPSYNTIQERELLDLINAEREAEFITPLKMDESLTRAARYHAFDMASQDYFMKDSYDRKNGQLVFVTDEFTRAGKFHTEKHIKAQNIAGGTTNSEATLGRWMIFDEQYDAMFDEDIKKVGIGLCYDPDSVYGYYWVLVTAKK